MKKILPGHGSGGKLMNDMISGMIKEILGKDSIQIDDSAVLEIGTGRIAFTTDSYTVTPIFFPGGDIGKLAVKRVLLHVLLSQFVSFRCIHPSITAHKIKKYFESARLPAPFKKADVEAQ